MGTTRDLHPGWGHFYSLYSYLASGVTAKLEAIPTLTRRRSSFCARLHIPPLLPVAHKVTPIVRLIVRGGLSWACAAMGDMEHQPRPACSVIVLLNFSISNAVCQRKSRWRCISRLPLPCLSRPVSIYLQAIAPATKRQSWQYRQQSQQSFTHPHSPPHQPNSPERNDNSVHHFPCYPTHIIHPALS